MAQSFPKILKAEKPQLWSIWQTGTVDAMQGIEPENFQTALETGRRCAAGGGADVILMNMQYSPRTDAVLAIAALCRRDALGRRWNTA